MSPRSGNPDRRRRHCADSPRLRLPRRRERPGGNRHCRLQLACDGRLVRVHDQGPTSTDGEAGPGAHLTRRDLPSSAHYRAGGVPHRRHPRYAAPTEWPEASALERSGSAGESGGERIARCRCVAVRWRHEAPGRSCGGFVHALRDHRSVRRGHGGGRMRLLLGLLVPPPGPQHLPLGVPLRASVPIGGRVREASTK
jgi:hypothetical protein